MGDITEADREAAKRLQVELADISGFWHSAGDAGPLAQALARHRIETEQRMLETASRFGRNTLQLERNPQILRPNGEAGRRRASPRA